MQNKVTLLFARKSVITIAMIPATLCSVLLLVCMTPSAPEHGVGVTVMPQGVIAPLDEALTFARLPSFADEFSLLLVVDQTESEAVAIDLDPWLERPHADAFEAVAQLGHDALARLARDYAATAAAYPLHRLLPAAETSEHVAFGTNFAGHGEEANNAGVFAFPKFSYPTSAVSKIVVDEENSLLDYEVELCMSFDRDIRSLADFDAALKAVFLCGDFTDRAQMLLGLPASEDNLSGIGFTDAKSGRGRLPTGPYTVVPRDWRSFVARETVSTVLNQRPMQYAQGSEMLLDFRQMVAYALEKGAGAHWRYRGQPVPLAPGAVIRKGMVLMSGTPEGVLFRPPTRRDIACGSIAYFCLAPFYSFSSSRDYVIDRFIQRNLRNESFLQSGDRIVHGSSRLGRIVVEVVAGEVQAER